MGAEISRVITQPVADSWTAFNKYCLDDCSSSCESPCCRCGVETHAHESPEQRENVPTDVKEEEP